MPCVFHLTIAVILVTICYLTKTVLDTAVCMRGRVCVCVCHFTRTHTCSWPWACVHESGWHVCMCGRLCVHVNVCARECVCMYTCLSMWMCISVRMCVRVCICTWFFFWYMNLTVRTGDNKWSVLLVWKHGVGQENKNSIVFSYIILHYLHQARMLLKSSLIHIE